MKRLNLPTGILFIMITLPVNIAAQEQELTTSLINASALFDPAPYGFSHAVVAENITKMAFISGQGGEDKTGKLSNQFADQVKQAYKNLQYAIEATGGNLNHVTKLTTYVVNYEQAMLEVMTHELVSVFGTHLPAQTLVPVSRLALDGMLFEVDATIVMKE